MSTNKLIKLNVPLVLGKEYLYIKDVLDKKSFMGNRYYGKKCVETLKKITKTKEVYLTFSATTSLEIAALLLDIKDGDEVIMSSFTFVSTANAFALRGARIIFVDIKPETMNINESLIEQAITKKTKAIVPVHYAGVACEMDKIMELAKKYNLYVVEDAAQCIGSKYKGKSLGTIGDIGCYSFDEVKNIHCGEGGSLFINNDELIRRSQIFCEKGTNIKDFIENKVDKYSWQDKGTKCFPDELNAAFLHYQLQNLKKINDRRLKLWSLYYRELKPLEEKNFINLPSVPNYCQHNAHIFFIKTKDKEERKRLMNFLGEKKIETSFHFVPLHSSPAGKKYGMFYGKDRYTTKESERLLRLPIYYDLSEEEVIYIVNQIKKFYKYV